MTGAIYVHIPFCVHKCPYCDFYSIRHQPELLARFLDGLAGEIALQASNPRWKNFAGTSIFLGGGTPSILRPEQAEKILQSIQLHFEILPEAEISFEANPGTLSQSHLAAFRDLGFNRISIGVQSFTDLDLQTLGRIHDAGVARAAISDARAAGFTSLGIDLIFGIPKQSLKTWQQNLETAIALNPDHISTYALTLEAGTPLAQWHAEGRIKIASDVLSRRMYLSTLELLSRAGYGHYEISNFARPGFECRHNLAYWNGAAYLGFGPSAHSFLNGERWWNINDLAAYLEAIEAGQAPIAGNEVLTPAEKMTEYILLSLRKKSGLDLRQFTMLFGAVAADRLHERLQTLEQEFFVQHDGVFALTPAGFLLYDSICADLIAAL